MLKSLWENVNRRDILTENEILQDILLTEVTNGATCLLRLIERQMAAGDEYWNNTSNEAKTANLDFNVSLEKAMKMLDGAKRGLGLVGKMDPGPEKVYHSKRIMTSMNKIRGLVQRLVKQGLEQHEEEELHTDVDTFVNDDSYNQYMGNRTSIRRSIEDRMAQRQMDKDIDGLNDRDTELDQDPSVTTMGGNYGTPTAPTVTLDDDSMNLDGPDSGIFGDDNLKNEYGDDRRVDSTTTPDGGFEYEDEEDQYELDTTEKQQSRFNLRRRIEDRMEQKRLAKEISGDDQPTPNPSRKHMSGDYGHRKSPEDVENEEFNWDAGNPNDDMTAGNDFSQDGGATHVDLTPHPRGPSENRYTSRGARQYGSKFEPGTNDPELSRRYHDDGGEEDIMDMGTQLDTEEDSMGYDYDQDDMGTDDERFNMNNGVDAYGNDDGEYADVENEEGSTRFNLGQSVSYNDEKQQFSGTVSGHKDGKVKIQIDDEFGGGSGWATIEHVSVNEHVSYQDLALSLVTMLGENDSMYKTTNPPGTTDLGVTATKDGQNHTLYGDEHGNTMVIRDMDGEVMSSYKGTVQEIITVLRDQGFDVNAESKSKPEMFKPASVRRAEHGTQLTRPNVIS